MAQDNSNEAKEATPSRQGLYAYAAKYSKEAIDYLVECMRASRNPSVRMGAAKALLDKCLPDLKATELTGEQGKEILVRLVPETMKPDGADDTRPTNTELPGPANDL